MSQSGSHITRPCPVGDSVQCAASSRANAATRLDITTPRRVLKSEAEACHELAELLTDRIGPAHAVMTRFLISEILAVWSPNELPAYHGIFIHPDTGGEAPVTAILHRLADEQLLILGIEDKVPRSRRVQILERSRRLNTGAHFMHVTDRAAPNYLVFCGNTRAHRKLMLRKAVAPTLNCQNRLRGPEGQDHSGEIGPTPFPAAEAVCADAGMAPRTTPSMTVRTAARAAERKASQRRAAKGCSDETALNSRLWPSAERVALCIVPRSVELTPADDFKVIGANRAVHGGFEPFARNRDEDEAWKLAYRIDRNSLVTW
jgi:hypothetical protein